jgi:CcmD family protein
MFKKIAALSVMSLCFLSMKAGSNMEEMMFRSGKIYTFLAVALIVLAGMFFYLFRLDRKLTKLENELKQKGKHP